MKGIRTFVGFGFGPIQAGLFFYEALISGNFDRLVVAEINSELVGQIRENKGCVSINIAFKDHIEVAEVNGIEIYNPNVDIDRREIIDAITFANEMATALPSVSAYKTSGPGSIHCLLAEGISKRGLGNQPFIIYTAENNLRAAELLQGAINQELSKINHTQLADYGGQIINTVIGKMSQVVDLNRRLMPFELSPIVPASNKAFLVESFNQILISKIDLEPEVERGIEAFLEKKDLLPFEEVKLYGHNATHAVLGFLGQCMGIENVSDLIKFPQLENFIKTMLIDEIGVALCKKYQGVDEFFTEENFKNYAESLIKRMLNPYLMDSIERLIRDPERKLKWDDRLIGAMRLCLDFGIEPRRLGFGVAAALYSSARYDRKKLFLEIDTFKKDWFQYTSNQSRTDRITEIIKIAAEDFLKWQNQDFSISYFDCFHK